MKALKLVVILMLTINCFGQKSNINEEGLALQGYDPVSYFTGDSPLEGKSDISATHKGVKHLFSSVENKNKFLANPQKYTPEYGGFCAIAVALGSGKYPVDPKTYTVTNDKLYLFYNGPYQGKHFNGLEVWDKNEDQNIVLANKNWKILQNK